MKTKTDTTPGYIVMLAMSTLYGAEGHVACFGWKGLLPVFIFGVFCFFIFYFFGDEN